MPRERITYIDSAKAIAIILVIIGHCYWLREIPKLGSLIYSFHMPLFFLISGFFIKDIGIVDALKKYSKAYLWPYLVIGMFIILIGIFKELYNSECWYGLIPLNITKILWGSSSETEIIWGSIPHIGPAWFLLALFWGCIVMSLLHYLKSRTEQVSIIVIAVCFSICSAKVIKMPVSLQGGVLCVAYIYIGKLVHRYNVMNSIFMLPPYVKIAAFVLWLLAAVFTGGVDIGSGAVGYSVVGFVVSLIGSFYVLYFCEKTKINFGWIGRNTLSILCAHILIWRIFDIFNITIKELSYHPFINFIIEVSCEVTLALFLGWIISKIHLLEFDKVRTVFIKQND